ncbi:MAG: acyltransferase family protein [Spirochaetales bacterium]|nr:acyltransferase family protein [Spirochaetales bacterium]
MSDHKYAYLSHLRPALAILVIAHHAGQAFGPTGGSWPVFNVERSPILGVFFAVNASFFMGLFFLIAGFFAYKSIVQKGARTFLMRKLTRLGIPTLIVAFGIFLPMAYLSFGRSMSPGAFIVRLYTDHWPTLFGHLWFLVHLLVYSGILAGAVTLGAFRSPPSSRRELTTGGIVLAIIGLAVVTAVVRVRYPIDDWRTVAFFIPSEVAHLPQYATLFVAGVFAARYEWFDRFSRRSGRRWLVVGVGAGVLRYVRWAVPAFSQAVPLATGGFNVGSVVWSGWETVICIGVPMTPFLKFAVSSILGTAATFALGDVARRVPAVRAIV